MDDRSSSTAAKKSKNRGILNFLRLGDRIKRHKLANVSANSTRVSVSSASSAHDLVPGNDAKSAELTASGNNATSHQDPTTPFQSARPPSSSVPDLLGSAVGQAKDILAVTWTGMEMLLKKVEGCLGGTLAKTPVAAVNAIIDIKNAVEGNKGAIENIIIQTAERLLAVDKAMDQGIPDSAKPRMTAFAGILRDEIRRLEQMASKGTFIRVLENEADRGAIEDIFKRIDEATKTFQVLRYLNPSFCLLIKCREMKFLLSGRVSNPSDREAYRVAAAEKSGEELDANSRKFSPPG
ncbi:hypothetical protein JOM56_012560 [Amanita muscaria]